ncbi:MAG: helix-turn-helix transcriptional regulator [Anaerolineae bacterium]|nr:helix-turn-helix transcriptional regulator [Anaerolineae bacterium]
MKEKRCRKIARRLQLLSHPARLRIVTELREKEMCVSELQAVLDRPQPYVSQQLCTLREAGIVAYRREGQYVYYRLEDPFVEQLLDEIAGPK